jgi:hypothetical protein
MTASTKSLERIAELWPSLSEAARTELIERAEASSADEPEFSAEQLAGIAR